MVIYMSDETNWSEYRRGGISILEGIIETLKEERKDGIDKDSLMRLLIALRQDKRPAPEQDEIDEYKKRDNKSEYNGKSKYNWGK